MLKYTIAFVVALSLSLVACKEDKIPQSLLLLSGEELAYTSIKEVTACYARLARPIMWLDTGEATGITVETLRAVANKINLKIKFIDKDNQAQVIEDFKLGKCDIATAVKETPDRAEFMDFTQPYLFIGTTMLVRQLPIKFPMRVGFGRKFGIESIMQRHAGQLEIVEFSSDRESFKALLQNDISAIVVDDLTAQQLEKENNIKFARAGVNFYYDIAFGFQKNNQLLGELLRKGLANLSVKEKLSIYKTEISK